MNTSECVSLKSSANSRKRRKRKEWSSEINHMCVYLVLPWKLGESKEAWLTDEWVNWSQDLSTLDRRRNNQWFIITIIINSWFFPRQLSLATTILCVSSFKGCRWWYNKPSDRLHCSCWPLHKIRIWLLCVWQWLELRSKDNKQLRLLYLYSQIYSN